MSLLTSLKYFLNVNDALNAFWRDEFFFVVHHRDNPGDAGQTFSHKKKEFDVLMYADTLLR